MRILRCKILAYLHVMLHDICAGPRPSGTGWRRTRARRRRPSSPDSTGCPRRSPARAPPRRASRPISDIEVSRTDRGGEFGNAKVDEMLDGFGIERSLSRKGCPYDNAIDESTNKMLKAELVYRETFGTTRELRVKLADYVHWHNDPKIHSTLGYMTPVEFRKAGLVLPRSSKKM